MQTIQTIPVGRRNLHTAFDPQHVQRLPTETDGDGGSKGGEGGRSAGGGGVQAGGLGEQKEEGGGGFPGFPVKQAEEEEEEEEEPQLPGKG